MAEAMKLDVGAIIDVEGHAYQVTVFQRTKSHEGAMLLLNAMDVASLAAAKSEAEKQAMLVLSARHAGKGRERGQA